MTLAEFLYPFALLAGAVTALGLFALLMAVWFVVCFKFLDWMFPPKGIDS